MNVLDIGLCTSSENRPICAQVATIGLFDGVHLGHQYLIRQVRGAAASAGWESMVITFLRHPRLVLQPDFQPKVLSSPDIKRLRLSHTGIDHLVMLDFDTAMAAMTARDFMEQVLRNRLNVQKLIIGYDHRFGHNRKEGFDEYVAYGRELGIEVEQAKPFEMSLGGQPKSPVSSSRVRAYIEKGDMESANACLGYSYTIIGKVVAGCREGRRLGFPTANLETSAWGQMIPAPGVYAVKVRRKNSMQLMRGMMNVGTRPTFDGKDQTIEVHIMNFQGDLYDDVLLVSVLHRVRDERRFGNADDLTMQLQEDRRLITELFEKEMEE